MYQISSKFNQFVWLECKNHARVSKR